MMNAWLSRHSLEVCRITGNICLKVIKFQPALSDVERYSNLRNLHRAMFISRYTLYSDVNYSPVGLASYYEMAEVSMNVYEVF